MFEFITLVALVVGPALAVDQAHKGNLEQIPAACELRYTRAVDANYSYANGVIDNGQCTIIVDHS